MYFDRRRLQSPALESSHPLKPAWGSLSFGAHARSLPREGMDRCDQIEPILLLLDWNLVNA